MIFYFSGIACAKEAHLLQQAGVQYMLVDPSGLPALLSSGWTGKVALDSGSYRAFKMGQTLSPKVYLQRLETILNTIGDRFDFITQPDVIGNPDQTLAHWHAVRGKHAKILPVWQWGAPLPHLRQFLDESPLVGLGGLVPQIRDRHDEEMSAVQRKTWDKERRKVLDELQELVEAYPGRFHLFGLCWIKAFNSLMPYLASADSSLWLEGARYRYAIFRHTKTGKLAHAPARIFKEYKDLDRPGLMLANAQNIDSFANRKGSILRID